MTPDVLSYDVPRPSAPRGRESFLSTAMALLAVVLCLPLTLENIVDFFERAIVFAWLALAGSSYVGATVIGWRASHGRHEARGGRFALIICALLFPAVLVRNTVLGHWFILRGFG